MPMIVKAPCASKRPQADVPFLGHAVRVIHVSTAIDNLLAEANQLSGSTVPVLISGETGTGKDLIARYIHRTATPYVTVDCTHLSSDLAESELFGHVRGAFTSAVSDRPGLIEMANGGTAFFDEIGELPLGVQAKLLRLLQQRTYRRVGCVHERQSAFRLLCATNRDLKREVKEGRFREDLYYRIAVAKLHVPPLRERKEDIKPLVEHFIGSEANVALTPDAYSALLTYEWPGNVRQLENCIQRASLRSTNGYIGQEHLPSSIRPVHLTRPLLVSAAAVGGNVSRHQALTTGFALARDAYQSSGRQSSIRSGCQELPLATLGEVEEALILKTLQATKGDRTEAAAILHIGRTTLYRKLKAMQARSPSPAT